MRSKPIQSPCRRVCVVDTDNQVCVGCLRSLEEIRLWGTYSDSQRREIMIDLRKRKSNGSYYMVEE